MTDNKRYPWSSYWLEYNAPKNMKKSPITNIEEIIFVNVKSKLDIFTSFLLVPC